MLSPVRLYIEGTLAVAIMATLAIISGFAAAAITGDRTLVMLASRRGVSPDGSRSRLSP